MHFRVMAQAPITMKYSRLDKDNAKKVDGEVDRGANLIGVDAWDGEGLYRSSVIEAYGLCGSCTNASITKTRYGTVYAKCNIWEKYLSGLDPIENCVDYLKRGQMSLVDMKEMAFIIEKPKDIGFR